MITYPLPRKIRYIPASATFTATFNTPTVGKYDFAGTSKVLIPQMKEKSLYMIDSVSIGGNIAAGDYFDAIDTIPVLSLRKSLGAEKILQPIQINGYFTDRQIVYFFKSTQNKMDLSADIVGVLKQTPALVGIPSISLIVTLTVYLIRDNEFEKQYTAQE